MKRQPCISTSSPVAEIEALRFFGLPKDRAINVTKIARHGSVTLYLADDRRLYSTAVRHNGCYVLGRGTIDDFIRAAAKLGVVAMAQVKEHLIAAAKFDAARHHRERAQTFRILAGKLGITLNTKQLRLLEKGGSK